MRPLDRRMTASSGSGPGATTAHTRVGRQFVLPLSALLLRARGTHVAARRAGPSGPSVSAAGCIVLAVGLALFPAGAAAQGERDDFDRLGQINKASIVMLAEAGLVPAPLAGTIAGGIAQVVEEQGEPGSRRSSD